MNKEQNRAVNVPTQKSGESRRRAGIPVLSDPETQQTHVDLFADSRGREYSPMKSSFLLFVGSFSMALGSSV